MTGFNPEEARAREHDDELAALPRHLQAYTHVEGLVGEDRELLEQAEEGRNEQHRKRLHAIREELDRVSETLRRRAERRSKSGT